MNRKTNRNVMEFFKDKNKHNITDEYLKEKEFTNSGRYLDFFNNLFSEHFEDNKDNEAFYKVLKAYENNCLDKDILVYCKEGGSYLMNKDNYREVFGELDELKAAFQDSVELEKIREYKENDQKLHLYLGIFAFCIVCDNYYDKDKNQKNKFLDRDFAKTWWCKQLRVWMVENLWQNIREQYISQNKETWIDKEKFDVFVKIFDGEKTLKDLDDQYKLFDEFVKKIFCDYLECKY